MSFVTNYNFDNLSRIGNEFCYQEQTTIQNVNTCNYLLQNYFADDCSMKRAYQISTAQPGVVLKGGNGSGAGGCNIDASSRLSLGALVTHPRSRIDLYQRPFVTVPYLGKGSVDPILEAQIQQGDMSTNRRSVTNLPEKSYMKYTNTPLLPDVYKRINHLGNRIESEASEGWIRGGLPSREMTRDTEKYNS
jgi:hypothetical protein